MGRVFLVSQFLLPGLFWVPGFNFLLVRCLSWAGGFPALIWHEKGKTREELLDSTSSLVEKIVLHYHAEGFFLEKKEWTI